MSGGDDFLRPATTAGFEPLVVEEGVLVSGGAPMYRAKGDRVFGLLSTSQFADPYLAARELYANALDACRDRPGAEIRIRLSPRQLVFEDDGPGLALAGRVALTTLGASTRRGEADAIGQFGVGFVSIFDPALGVARVELWARAPDDPGAAGVRLAFVRNGGAVRIEEQPAPAPPCGTRVEVGFDPEHAPVDRVRRFRDVLREYAAYSGVPTSLDGERVGRRLERFVPDAVERRRGESPAELRIISESAVEGPVGTAAVDPTQSEVEYRLHQRGLFVCNVRVPREEGKPWIRGGLGAAHAEDSTQVASRNGFVEDAAHERLMHELLRLHREASYRVVKLWETERDGFARLLLVDAIRRGLKVGNRESLLAASDDLFSSAVVRSPLFRCWNDDRLRSFEELAELARRGAFRGQSFRPSAADRRRGPIFRADASVERDVFRRLSGSSDMPAAARSERVGERSLWSRLSDRFLSGPKAEYSLFRAEIRRSDVEPSVLELIEEAERFLASAPVQTALERLLPGTLPRLGVGSSGNAFGPVAAYRASEMRLNVRHRVIQRLARAPADLGVRGLLPVLAHELAHVCHELHDDDFYRTSRTLLRALATAAAELDAQHFTP